MRIWISVALILGCSAPEPEVASEEDSIVGGKLFTGLPAVGALTQGSDTFCTGTLIAPRKVLTAAHCLDGISAKSIRFKIGPSVASASEVLEVTALERHPRYNRDTVANDIGLVTLAQDAGEAPLGVLEKMDSSWVGRSLLFVGYGATSAASDAGIGKKRAVKIAITEINATTFEYDDPVHNTCFSDSGGPAFYEDAKGKFWIAGVTSWGDPDCRNFGVDTRADVFASFVGGASTPAPASGATVEGVTFTARQVTAVLELVNQSPAQTLDDDVGLDARAVANIMAARPLATLQELAAISYVGTAALERLRTFVGD